MSDMAMPQRIGELPKGPDRKTYIQVIPAMAAHAMEDRCLPGNPRPVDERTFEDLFASLY